MLTPNHTAMENTLEPTIIIYALKCPISFSVKYIGKTLHPKRRFYQHTSETGLAKSTHLANWISKLLREHGLKPIFESIEVCNQYNWQERETYWIKHYSSFGQLCNHTEGGEGCHGRKMSDEMKEKISKTHKGKKKNYRCIGGVKQHKAESKIKISRSKTGAPKKGKAIHLTRHGGETTEFDNLTIASKKTGISITSISNNLRNYSKQTSIGIWKYKTH